jgi:hypothetical protein
LRLDDETRFVTISCQSDLTQSKYSVFWFIAKKVDENVVYLIFRGTSSLDDILIDLAADLDSPEVIFYLNRSHPILHCIDSPRIVVLQKPQFESSQRSTNGLNE